MDYKLGFIMPRVLMTKANMFITTRSPYFTQIGKKKTNQKIKSLGNQSNSSSSFARNVLLQ